MAMKRKQEANQERTLKEETTKRRGSAIIFRNSGNVNMVTNARLPMKQMGQTMKRSLRGRKSNRLKSVTISRNLVDANLEMTANFPMTNQQTTTKERMKLITLEHRNKTGIKLKYRHTNSNLRNETSAGTFSSLVNANSAMIANLNMFILISR